MNSNAPYITETSNTGDTKDKTLLGVTASTPTHIKFGISTLKCPVWSLSSHRVELEMRGLVELGEDLFQPKTDLFSTRALI